MKALILWSDPNAANLGVQALARGAEALAESVWGVSDVDFQSFDEGPLGTQLSGSVLAKSVLTLDRRLLRSLRNYDVVVDTGAGDSFTDIYGWKRLVIMTYVRMLAARSGVPVILAPQTFGPFNSAWSRRLARSTMARVNCSLSRDSTSSAYASNVLGRSVDFTGSDLVFALHPVEMGVQRDVLVNVSGLLWNANPHIDYRAYRKNVVLLVRELQKEGRSVSLLAHVLDNSSQDNDLPAMKDVAEQIGGGIELLVPGSLVEVREMVAGASVVVGSRMHACLNAMSVGTPAIAWAYSRKFAPLMEDLGWPYAIDLNNVGYPVRATLNVLRSVDLNAAILPVGARAKAKIAETMQYLKSEQSIESHL